METIGNIFDITIIASIIYFIYRFLNYYFSTPYYSISKEEYKKLVFILNHDSYGRSFQYDDNPSKEESKKYYESSLLADKYKYELSKELRWFIDNPNFLPNFKIQD